MHWLSIASTVSCLVGAVVLALGFMAPPELGGGSMVSRDRALPSRKPLIGAALLALGYFLQLCGGIAVRGRMMDRGGGHGRFRGGPRGGARDD